MNQSICIVPFQGESVRKYIPEIARIRLEIFQEYPYLYQGDYDAELRYLNKYAICQDAIVFLAFKGSEILGVLTGIPLILEENPFKMPFIKANLSLSDYFYLGEVAIKKSFRGKGIGHQLMSEVEKHVRTLCKFKYICLCTIKREDDDPRRPINFISSLHFWESQGYELNPELSCFLSWRENAGTFETQKEMQFLIKRL